jgi:hypothetical protein
MNEEIPVFPPLKSIGIGILPRQTYNWTEDEKVDKCYNCQVVFTWYTRKHHCRGCGRIFCYNCTQYFIMTNKINSIGLINPDEYLNECFDNNSNLQYQKVCYSCLNIYFKIKEVSKTLKVLYLLPLTLKEIYKLRLLNKIWYEACNLYLSKFKEIQYNLPNHNINIEMERNLLLYNLDYIISHNKLLCRLIKTSNIQSNFLIKKIKEHYSKTHKNCRLLMCDKNCQNRLTNEDILDILINVSNPNIREYVLSLFDDSLINIYAPLLIYSLRNDIDNKIISDYLLHKSLYNNDFQQRLYCELLIYIKQPHYNKIYKDTFDILVQIINDYSNETIKNRIKRFNIFINNINDNDRNFETLKLHFKVKDKDKDKEFIGHGHGHNIDHNHMLPLDIQYIDFDGIVVFTSKTLPKLFPYIDTYGNKKALLYKNEDVRNDYIIQSIIKCMDYILKNNGLDMEIITYDVLPLTTTSGLIEIVKDSETIYNIKNKYNKSILNYILDKNPDETIHNIRNKFIKSTAVYSIISYLLGIGDRHLDNIMITNDGKLFHIDYSYILGVDCKILAPKIRLTPEMIDCIGGINSPYYETFENYCKQVYNILRAHVNIFSCFFNMLTNKCNADNEIKKRFLPGEFTEQANIQLIKTIEINQSNFTFIDFIHHHYKDTLSPYSWKDSIYKLF